MSFPIMGMACPAWAAADTAKFSYVCAYTAHQWEVLDRGWEIDEYDHRRTEAARLGAPALHAVLAVRDPVMAGRLLPTDPQRIVRALEVMDATGRSLADWHAMTGTPLLRTSGAHCICLRPSRAWLQSRCDRRFDLMMAGGALDEVRGLARLDLDPRLPVMSALGVRPMLRHLQGGCTLEQAVIDGKAETRRYVKRQETWFNRHMITWNRINSEENYKISSI